MCQVIRQEPRTIDEFRAQGTSARRRDRQEKIGNLRAQGGIAGPNGTSIPA